MGLAARRLSQRTFLKGLFAALGGIGVGQLAAGARPAAATYTAGPPDVVNTNLTVQGNLIVTAPNRMGIGTQTPQGALDVAGDIRVNGAQAIASNGWGKQCYYVAGPTTTPPPTTMVGSWGRTGTSTWTALSGTTWGQLQTMDGSWNRVAAYTWDQLIAYTWGQVQSL